MTGTGASQQSAPENPTSSPPTAASNTSNASNAEGSTLAIDAHTFRNDLTHEWYRHGGGTLLGNDSMSGGIHSSAPHSQDQDQNHTHAASSADDNARNDTAGELPQPLSSTAQHFPDTEASTSRSMTAAGHDDGFVRPETSHSVLPDSTDTDASSLPPARVNRPGPSSSTPHGNTAFDAVGSDDEDSDEGLVKRAMRETSEIITQASLSAMRKRNLLLKVAVIFQRRGKGYPEIAAMVDSVSSSIKKSSTRNLRRKFASIVKKLDNIKERLAQLTGSVEVTATASESGKRKAPGEFDTEEHGQPSTKKSRLSGATTTQEKQAACESDLQKLEKLSHTYADQTVIVNDDLGHAPDEVRYSMSFYKDALVVSTDGSFGISPASRHAGAGAAWLAPETDNEGSNPGGMKWHGISWPLCNVIDGEPSSSAYAERMAIRLALHTIAWREMTEGVQKLVIQTDSTSCLHQIKTGLEKDQAPDPDINDIVAYVLLLRLLEVDVKFTWVKGHHQCIGNRIADRFANGGRVLSELGTPPITSLDDEIPPGEVRTYAAGLLDKPWKKPTCDAGTQTEPLTDENEGGTAEAANALQGSSESPTMTAGFLPDAEPYTTGTSTSTAPVANPQDEALGTANAQGTSLSTALQTKLQNHVGATTQLAHFSLATTSAGSSAFAVDDASKNESRAHRDSRRRWQHQRVD
ncbi:hypothetical protein NU219Hw_g4754t1 [Hortaea werneckii]